MNRQIVIGMPYVTKGNLSDFNESVRLCADVTMMNFETGCEDTRTLYFEVDREYEFGLCTERSDAFVLAMLNIAMDHGMDIVYAAPMSERLFYQLETYFLPIYAMSNPHIFKSVHLLGETADAPVLTKNKVVTGCSGGVDSFYTIVRHTQLPEHMKPHELTHLVFMLNTGKQHNMEELAKWFSKRLPEVKRSADLFGLGMIGIFSNYHEFCKKDETLFLFQTVWIAHMYALQYMIGVCYFSSTYPVQDFHIQQRGDTDFAAADIFNFYCMNTDNMTIYSTGSETTRFEKEREIAVNDVVKQNLMVCLAESDGGDNNQEYINCGKCKKCIRTMTNLYFTGALEEFRAVFPVDDYLKHKNRYIGKYIAFDNDFYKEMAASVKKLPHKKIPIKAKMWGYLCYTPIRCLQRLFHGNRLVAKLYYALNMDYKLHGYRGGNRIHYLEMPEKKK